MKDTLKSIIAITAAAYFAFLIIQAQEAHFFETKQTEQQITIPSRNFNNWYVNTKGDISSWGANNTRLSFNIGNDTTPARFMYGTDDTSCTIFVRNKKKGLAWNVNGNQVRFSSSCHSTGNGYRVALTETTVGAKYIAAVLRTSPVIDINGSLFSTYGFEEALTYVLSQTQAL